MIFNSTKRAISTMLLSFPFFGFFSEKILECRYTYFLLLHSCCVAFISWNVTMPFKVACFKYLVQQAFHQWAWLSGGSPLHILISRQHWTEFWLLNSNNNGLNVRRCTYFPLCHSCCVAFMKCHGAMMTKHKWSVVHLYILTTVGWILTDLDPALVIELDLEQLVLGKEIALRKDYLFGSVSPPTQTRWYPRGVQISLHIRSPGFWAYEGGGGGGYFGVNFGHLKSEVFLLGGWGVFWSEIPESPFLENLDKNLLFEVNCTETCLCVTDSLSHTTYVETKKVVEFSRNRRSWQCRHFLFKFQWE